ncbi:TPA: hypothetical protein KMB23_002583 [Escherichia coli]|nr:hypothetical protein [Escherichia coli]EFH8188324.1 hypothetical protein [Escherichia coli]HBE5570196.1 hypothetical protein [Escherichia coli]HBH8759505.1 hypothetical protein [Escherichia coli]
MKPEDSVLQELEQLTGRMHQLCVDNNIAFVSCYSYEISRNETGMATSRHLSVYVDEEKSVFCSAIAAAYGILQLESVPREVIFALEKLAERQEKERKVISNAHNVMH